MPSVEEKLRELGQTQLQTEGRNPSSSGEVETSLVASRARGRSRRAAGWLFRNEPKLGGDSCLHAINPDIRMPREEGTLLVQFYTEPKPQRTVEVGPVAASRPSSS